MNEKHVSEYVCGREGGGWEGGGRQLDPAMGGGQTGFAIFRPDTRNVSSQNIKVRARITTAQETETKF